MPASPISCPPQGHSFLGALRRVRLWSPVGTFSKDHCAMCLSLGRAQG